MLFRNYTPFSPLHFESRDENQNDFGVVVLRGTFEMEGGRPLRMVEGQEPILFKDEYWGDPQSSSLKFDSCMAPFKPKTDVLVNAIAYSPTYLPEKMWDVSVRFGTRQKKLTVTGPRRWVRKLGLWELTDISPVSSLPLQYELAFGGCYVDAEGVRKAWPENPIGRGFVDPRNREPVDVPQIFQDADSARHPDYGRPDVTAGLGPVAPHWAPRSERVGTYNEMWKRTRFPDLPADFDFHFYNSGSTGMTLDGFAEGNEEIELVNLTEERKTVFQLPNYQLGSLMRFENGEILPGPVLLDTVHIDAMEARVYLTWRTVYPVNVPLRALEIRAKDISATSPDEPYRHEDIDQRNLDDDEIYYPAYY